MHNFDQDSLSNAIKTIMDVESQFDEAWNDSVGLKLKDEYITKLKILCLEFKDRVSSLNQIEIELDQILSNMESELGFF